MSDRPKLSDYDVAEVARYVKWLESGGSMKQINFSALWSFKLPKTGGWRVLRRSKAKMLKHINENVATIGVIVEEYELDENQKLILEVISQNMALYVEVLEGQIARVDEILAIEKTQVDWINIDPSTIDDDEIPF